MGRAPLGGAGQPNYGNEMMRMVALMNQAKYDKERAAYYGAEKESNIAKRQADIEAKQEKQLDTDVEREFSQETGLPFKKGVDEPAVASLRTAKRAEMPPPPGPARREDPGLLAKLFSPPRNEVIPPPGEDPSITQGRIMGTKAAMVPNLYEQAQKQVQDMGYNDPASKMYSPEATRAAGTRTMRAEDVDKTARESAITKEHFGKAREQDIKASREQIGLNKDQRNAQLMDAYARTDPKNTRVRDEFLRQIAANQHQVADIAGMDKNRREGYLAAVKQSSDATQRLLEAQKAFPKAIDVHAGLAQEASDAALVAAELTESPMVDLVTAMPYNKIIPFTGQNSVSNRVKVPTEYARANRDGVVEAMIRAPINPKDSEFEQDAQLKKQGEYLAWKIVHQNPEYLGNPVAFEAALEKAPVNPYIRLTAKHHMGLYMQMNPDTRAEADKVEQTTLGPPTPEKWGFNLPGGKDPVTGEALAGPRISDVKVKEGLAGILPAAPKGGMFGTEKTLEDYIGQDQKIEPPRELPVEPTETPGPTGPVGPPKGSNLPTLRGVPKAGAKPVPAAPGEKWEYTSNTIEEYIASGKKINSPKEAANFGEWMGEVFRRRAEKQTKGPRVDIRQELRSMTDKDWANMQEYYRSQGGR